MVVKKPVKTKQCFKWGSIHLYTSEWQSSWSVTVKMVKTISLWLQFFRTLFHLSQEISLMPLHWLGSLLVFCYRPILHLLGVSRRTPSPFSPWCSVRKFWLQPQQQEQLDWDLQLLPFLMLKKNKVMMKDWWIFHININFSSCKDLIFIFPMQMNYIWWAFTLLEYLKIFFLKRFFLIPRILSKNDV